jgi:hypothetical protein
MGLQTKRNPRCGECGGATAWSKYCGAQVCLICDNHIGLVRCFCNWSLTRPGHGKEELKEMGEQIEPT